MNRSNPLLGLLGGLCLCGGTTPPPDSIPLRILGLEHLPTSLGDLRSAFRAKLVTAHPDAATYTAPHLQSAAEAIAATTNPDVQELVWARDLLTARIPKSVTDNSVTQGNDTIRNGLDGVDYRCKNCKDERRNPSGVPYPQNWQGRWARWCWPCAREAENARQRALRAQARGVVRCGRCNREFAPARTDSRYCSSGCRQAAYRNRKQAAK